jgi:hypothetical protein
MFGTTLEHLKGLEVSFTFLNVFTQYFGYIDPHLSTLSLLHYLLHLQAYVHNPNHSCLDDGIFYIKSFVITFIWQIRYYCFMIFHFSKKPLIQFYRCKFHYLMILMKRYLLGYSLVVLKLLA